MARKPEGEKEVRKEAGYDKRSKTGMMAFIVLVAAMAVFLLSVRKIGLTGIISA